MTATFAMDTLLHLFQLMLFGAWQVLQSLAAIVTLAFVASDTPPPPTATTTTKQGDSAAVVRIPALLAGRRLNVLSPFW